MAAPTGRMSAAVMLVFGLAALIVWLAALAWVLPHRRPLPAFPHGVVRVAIDATYPPFAFVDADGALAGVDADIGRAIAEQVGLPLELVNIGIDGLYDALRADRVDLVISSLQPEPWRTHEVRYTRSYFNAGLVLVTPPDSPIRAMTDLPGESLAYEFGSAADVAARAWLRRVPAFETRPYELPTHALDAVRLGEASAALVDSITARLYARQHPGWQPTMTHVTDTGYVIAVRLDRQQTFRAVERALGDLLSGGIIDRIVDDWL